MLPPAPSSACRMPRPGGANRWKPPQPRAPWAPAVVNATTASPVCAQVQQPSGTPTGVEDCLFMNIWTRDLTPDEPAPVLVWFHTGGFTNASANFAGTNGRRLAEERGIVVVAPNYRVGSLGFLAHGSLATEDPAHPTSGNYGLLDQQAALRWVRDNVARFGGDPDSVTIGGTLPAAPASGCSSSLRRARDSSIARSFKAPIRRHDGRRTLSTWRRAIPWRPRSAASSTPPCRPACAARRRTRSCWRDPSRSSKWFRRQARSPGSRSSMASSSPTSRET